MDVRMDFFRKVESREFPAEAVLWIILAPLLFVVILLFGFGFLLLVPVGLVYGITNIAMLVRSRNWGYLILALFFFLMSAFATTLALHQFIDTSWTFSFAVAWVTSLGMVIFMGLNRTLKWWSYEILEMAAVPVDEIKEGFTNRPLPIGKITSTREEMIRFARFIQKHLIAIPVIEPDKVVFRITHTRFNLLSLDKNYSNESYISFTNDGMVTVNIAQEDYQKYKDSYAFDQLCDHLGKLFIEFFEYYKKGDKEMILHKLKNMYQH